MPTTTGFCSSPADGTFESAVDGTFVPAPPGTFECDTGGTFNPLLSKIADWGQESGCLAINYQSGAKDIAYKLKYHHLIAETDRRRAMAIYEIVCQHNIELLDEADKLAEKDLEENISTEPQKAAVNERPVNDITIKLIQEMVEWDRKKRILEDWKWKVMDDVANGKKPLTNRYKYTFYLNLEQLRKKGFPK